MFTYPWTINPASFGGATEDKIFDLLYNEANVSYSNVIADALTLPYQLHFSHDVRTVNGTSVKGHLIRITQTHENDEGKLVDLSASMALKVPFGISSVTTAEIRNIVGRVAAICCNNTTLDGILANQT